MAEDIIGNQPLHFGAGGVGEVHVDRQRLLGIGGDRAGGQALIEVDPELGGLRGRVGPGGIDQLDHVLLVVGRRDRGHQHARFHWLK